MCVVQKLMKVPLGCASGMLGMWRWVKYMRLDFGVQGKGLSCAQVDDVEPPLKGALCLRQKKRSRKERNHHTRRCES